MNELIQAADWSDRFFAFDDAVAAYGEGRDWEASRFLLEEAADSFLRLHPACPFDRDWLVRDFLRRV